MPFELPKLSYAYDALEPYIDAKTMEIHHSKHHQTYLDKTNGILALYPSTAGKGMDVLLKNLGSQGFSEADRRAFQNHGGGFYNHSFFWTVMGPKKEVDDALAADVEKSFGSLDAFKVKFEAASLGQFGSGWTWLVRDEAGALQIYALPNQDCPLSVGHTPLFCLDLWEHAYYLKYQNRRAEYVKQWWNVLKLLP